MPDVVSPLSAPAPGLPQTSSAPGFPQPSSAPGSAAQQDVGRSTPPAAVAAPVISLPKGGGAIRGIDEKFETNPVNGTATLSIGLAASPGRAGFGPELSLAYDSGSGNGPFGFGWSVSVPAITRKTDKGLPRYEDTDESDVFVLSGAEDLVPVLGANGERFEQDRELGGRRFVVHRYRPRIEGLFSRIERWTDADTGEVHWRSLSRDNVTTLYGRSGESRIADPADPRRVFSWLMCERRDSKGNAISCRYAGEDGDGADLPHANERNRTRTAQRYLKRVCYGNRVSHLIDPDPDRGGWLFEVVFDYDEGHLRTLDGEPAGPVSQRRVEAGASPVRTWGLRPDPFSSFRAGFEVRTYRRCARVLVFHHLPELGPEPTLVAATHFGYADLDYGRDPSVAEELEHEGSTRFASFLCSVTRSGYARASGSTYLEQSMPPLELSYSRAVISEQVRELPAGELENAPVGLQAGYQWIDLDGQGLPGILSEQAGAWFYKPNLGGGRFEPAHPLAIPVGAGTGGGRQVLRDLAGTGRIDLVDLDGVDPGFYEHVDDRTWGPFRSFASRPVIDWSAPSTQFVDLTGDGLADVLVTEDHAFTWHASLADAGFGPAERVAQALDEERGPRLVFSDGTESIYLADMCGDGLADLVRVRNGAVCYWPNLGYGRFGPKVTMDAAPVFDAPDLFSQRRVRLADLDGSGTTDIVYLGSTGAALYFNQSGNRWTGPRRVTGFPHLDDPDGVVVVDLLGRGTACLVWSSSLPQDAGRPLRYLELMAAGKPHLLTGTDNNLGVRSRIEYASSTTFYAADRAAARSWRSSLPFPVQVVERVLTDDLVSRTRSISRHAYHDGYFDPVEREFRGFGMVEQWDAEGSAALRDAPEPEIWMNLDECSDVPPVLTITWFHTGRPGRSAPDWEMPEGLSPAERLEAFRVLKGAMLRQEVYGLDDTPAAEHPYTVAEQRFGVRLLQHRGGNRHAVFLRVPAETIKFQYERDLGDPRVSHQLTLETDAFGNVLRECAISYGRRQGDPQLSEAERAVQAATLITLVENAVTCAVRDDDAYRAPLPAETRKYELTGVAGPDDGERFTHDELRRASARATAIGYEQTATPGQLEKRLLEHVRIIYRRDDLTGPLPLGQLESLALPFDSYQLALTTGLIGAVFGDRVDEEMLRVEGRYVRIEGQPGWWVPSGRQFYTPASPDDTARERAHARRHFFLPHRFRGPFHTPAAPTESVVSYDPHDLIVVSTRDAAGNLETLATVDDHGGEAVRIDYRTLQPEWLTDPNGNRTRVAFDALGRVVATALMGKPPPAAGEGDSLDSLSSDLGEAEILACLRDPLTHGRAALGSATSRFVYDAWAFRRSRACAVPQPVTVYTITREQHCSAVENDEETKLQHRFSYLDGFGREVQAKTQAEPDPGDPDAPRWVGTGWVVFNNKGLPVRQFEPFFTPTHRFEFNLRIGVSSTLLYDAVGRLIAMLHPNHSWEKVRFDPWRQETWDACDTALEPDPAADPDVGNHIARLPRSDYLPTWYAQRIDGALGPDERRAARQVAGHAGTPTVIYADPLGRTFLTVVHNRIRRRGRPDREERYRTRRVLNVEGDERERIDAVGRSVMRYDHDIRGSRIHEAGMESGERWTLPDLAGNPVRSWDSRGHRRRVCYDVLRRPTRNFVAGIEPDHPDRELLTECRVYGEQYPDGRARNARGRRGLQLDQAGSLGSDGYDFKGNMIESSRRMARNRRGPLDWTELATRALDRAATDPIDPATLAEQLALATEAAEYRNQTSFDALERVVLLSTPDGSRTRRHYNEAGLLARVDVNLRGATDGGAPAWTTIVTDIAYDAKGQRTRIIYGNGAVTTFAYDPLTLRLVGQRTRRARRSRARDAPRPRLIQDQRYTHDPAGNITHIADGAQQDAFFRNRRVEPGAEYVYDASYRLISATGREHVGQSGRPAPYSHDDAPRAGLAQPGDGLAMARYEEFYEYDSVGNLLAMRHRGADPANPGWKRSFRYAEPSRLDPDAVNNQLSSTSTGDGSTARYSYDAHGNLTRLPHLGGRDPDPNLFWNDRDQLAGCELPGGGSAFYAYDSAGLRVTKRLERSFTEERLYLGAVELYRRLSPGGETVLERETLVIGDGETRLAMIETRTHGAGRDRAPARVTRYQLGDQLGSVALELDARARVISYEEYAPYGSTTYQAVARWVETPKRYRFTAMERDEETGLEYHAARYYASWLGRWTSCDPDGLQPGINVYAYVSCMPTRIVDPSGRGFWDHVWGVVKAVGGALEVAAGVGIMAAAGWTGVGLVVGGLIAAHGLDTTQAGVRQAVTGEQTDTFTSQGLQALGMSRRAANLTDAAIGVAGTLGGTLVTKAPAVVAAGRTGAEADALVHMTTADAAATINSTQQLGKGASTVYAGPASLADASAAGRMARAGLPAAADTAVAVPNAAANAFRVPAVVGPFTAWQRSMGTVYTAGAGSINLTTGAFTRTGMAWNQWLFYGIDATLNMAGRSAPTLQHLDDPDQAASQSSPPNANQTTGSLRSTPLAPSPTINFGGISPVTTDPLGASTDPYAGPVDELYAPRQQRNGVGITVRF